MGAWRDAGGKPLSDEIVFEGGGKLVGVFMGAGRGEGKGAIAITAGKSSLGKALFQPYVPPQFHYTIRGGLFRGRGWESSKHIVELRFELNTSAQTLTVELNKNAPAYERDLLVYSGYWADSAAKVLRQFRATEHVPS